MEERIYHLMKRTGGWNIALGIFVIVMGVSSGVLLIIGGSRLLAGKSKIMF